MTKGMRIYKEREKALLEECLKQEERGELSHDDAMFRYYMVRDEILDAIPDELFNKEDPIETATYKRFVYGIRIFLKDGYKPMAELAFGNGGRANGETIIIPWDEPKTREQYVINAYTLIWDERLNSSFEDYIRNK